MAASRVAPRPRLSLRPLWFLVPVALVALALVAGNRGLPDAPPLRPAPARDGSPRTHGRLVVLLVDSLARANVEDAALMPNLHALSRAQGTAYLDVRTCASNFSLPCIQTIFAGRESPMSA